MKKIILTEDDYHAYVDNQISAEKKKAVEKLMQQDHKIAQQIKDWQQQNILINDFYSSQPTDMPPIVIPKKAPKKVTYAIAASLFFTLLGGSIGWFAHGYSQPTMTQNTHNFVNSAISAHQVYTVEVLHPVEVLAAQKSQLVSWLSKRINHSLTIPNIDSYGYSLLGGRLLSMRKGRAAAQLMFENKAGQRLTLLVSKNPIYRNQAFHLKRDQNINAYYWMDAHVAYSITSEMDTTHLQKLSKAIYLQINTAAEKQLVSSL